jgi:sodium/proline symporter
MLVVLIFGGRPSQATAIVMSCVGISTALLWRFLDLHNMVYEGLPGIVAGVLVYLIAKLFSKDTSLTAALNK